MILWRISAFPDLSGYGGLMSSGRWHRVGQAVVYLADSPASAMLEILVHLEVDPEDLPDNLRLMRVDVPEALSLAAERPPLPPDWFEHPTLSQTIGTRWLRQGNSALMQVPSAIVPHTHNWLLNPAHAHAAGIALTVETLELDSRLFKGR